MRRHPALLLLLLSFLCAGAVILSARLGYMRIDSGTILNVIAARLGGGTVFIDGLDPAISHIVWEVRLPRILLAALVGASLATSGVIYQGILLNPLADPYTLGVSSGAAFGASLALLLNVALASIPQPLSVSFFAFGGSVITLLVVLRLSSFNGQISNQSLILSGVIVGAILSAGISFFKYLADEQVALIIFWLMGSFTAASWQGVAILTCSLVCGMGVSFFYARDLNIISLGRRSADSLGVDTARIRIVLLLTASFLAALCVSISGIIGFIGLIVPHLVRYITGPDNRILLPASALCGALLLLCADTLTRAILPVEIPIGVLTALVGGPFFCIIFRNRQRGLHEK